MVRVHRLDMGHLSLQGLVCQGKSNTMTWTIAFSSMSADMPYAISDMYVGKVDDQLSEQTAACLRQVLDTRRSTMSGGGLGENGADMKEHENPQNYLVEPFGVVLNVEVSFCFCVMNECVLYYVVDMCVVSLSCEEGRVMLCAYVLLCLCDPTDK
jgi:hypothetical protein